MPEIFSVTPGRGRAGQVGIAINGAGFAPATPFGNTVEFEGSTAFSIASQDETDIVVSVPGCFTTFGLCVTDKWIAIAVLRKDSQEWAMFRWWIKEDLLELQSASGLTEKVPTFEDLDDPTNECLTAATWNRLVTFVEWLAYEILTAKGSILGRELAGLVQVLVGPNGTELRRVEAGTGRTAGLIWGEPKRTWTLRWGRLIDASNVRNGTMTANGAADDSIQSEDRGTHGMPRSGVLRWLVVNVETAGSGNTLDRVIVTFNLAVTLHDSGTALGIGAGGAYRVDLGTWRKARDLEVEVFKLGTGGTMAITATITIEEEQRPADINSIEDTIDDAIAVSDSLAVDLILGASMSDAVAVTDALAVELVTHVELADAAAVVDALAVEVEAHRELADQIDAHDTIQVEVTQ